MLKRIRKFFNRLGHGVPDAPLLESVPVNPVEFSGSEYKADLSVDKKQALSPDKSFEEVLTMGDRNLDRDALGQILEFLPGAQSKTLAGYALNNCQNKFFAESLRAHRQKIEEVHLPQTLLDAIDRGEEDKVKEMLDKFKTSHPWRLAWILSFKASFTDHAGRTFYGITALQYAAWNLDTPMRDLIRSYMNEKEVAQQIDARDKNGIDYSMPLSDLKQLTDIAPEQIPPLQYIAETCEILESKEEEMERDKYISLNEKQYDWSFRVFQSALQTYIDAVTLMIQKSRYDWDLLDKLWLNVGFTQRYLTAPYVNAYCCETRFNPLPNFNAVTPARKTAFYNWSTNKTEDFFESLNNLGLGFSFGIVKGLAERPRGGAGRRVDDPAGGGVADLEALGHLCEVRTADYQALKEEIQPALRLEAARF